MSVVIPAFAAEFLDAAELSRTNPAALNVATYMHRKGINLRYIGFAISAIIKVGKRRENVDKEALSVATKVLLLEAVSRVIKNQLNKKLRKTMKELKLPLEVRL